jgi:D-amino-acid dehydrogenase
MHVIVLGAACSASARPTTFPSLVTRSPWSTARPQPLQKPASPTAGRSRSATPSRGPTPARRSRCCNGWARKTRPLLFRLRADMRQWLWGLQFLRECTPARTRHNIEQIVRLGTYSRATLQQLRATRACSTTSARRASCTSTPRPKSSTPLKPRPNRCAHLGCDRRVISADEAVRLEPALRHMRPQLAGATYTAEDESGDANRFARELVRLCEDGRDASCMSHTVTALREAGGSIDHVEATDDEGRFQRLRPTPTCWRWAAFSPLLR